MRAANDQAEEWRLQVCSRQQRGVDVAPQMVDARQRRRPRGCQALAHSHADQEAAHQSRSARHREQVDVTRFDACRLDRHVEQLRQALQVVARRELGHDSAEPLVHVDLRVDHVAEDAAPLDDRD